VDATSASELEALRSLAKREVPLARLAHWLIDARTERLTGADTVSEALDLHTLAALVDTRDDEDTLRAASVDSGRILARKPRALAAPRSARDVVEIVRWANRVGSPVALRGRGHTQGGQSLDRRRRPNRHAGSGPDRTCRRGAAAAAGAAGCHLARGVRPCAQPRLVAHGADQPPGHHGGRHALDGRCRAVLAPCVTVAKSEGAASDQ